VTSDQDGIVHSHQDSDAEDLVCIFLWQVFTKQAVSEYVRFEWAVGNDGWLIENNEIRVQYMSLDWWRYLPTSWGMPSTRNKGIRW